MTVHRSRNRSQEWLKWKYRQIQTYLSHQGEYNEIKMTYYLFDM